jgi:phage head maturation protease
MKQDIKELIRNKAELIEFKKAQFKACDSSILIDKEIKSVNKALSTSTEHDTDTVIKRTIIGNTYNWLDSHGDVHLKGTFTKSINERQSKINHLHDHEQKTTAKVGKPSKVYEKEVLWSDLGVNKIGSTIAVMMDTNILKDFNSMVFRQYKDGDIDQHSVGMYYVKIDLAVNDPEEEEEYKVWTENINQIGNKEKAEEAGYFWAVKEAKLIEISAVLEGSNELTPTIEAKDIQPSNDTDTEPSRDTQNDSGKGSDKINYFKFI